MHSRDFNPPRTHSEHGQSTYRLPAPPTAASASGLSAYPLLTRPERNSPYIWLPSFNRSSTSKFRHYSLLHAAPAPRSTGLGQPYSLLVLSATILKRRIPTIHKFIRSDLLSLCIPRSRLAALFFFGPHFCLTLYTDNRNIGAHQSGVVHRGAYPGHDERHRLRVSLSP